MIDRFLRRLTVRSRIFAGYLILLLLSALALPLIVANQSFVTGRLRQITEVDTRADRLLLLASTRVESSRVNLMRYVQDYSPSVYEAQDDVDQAEQLLQEARDLLSAPQAAALDPVLTALGDYRQLIDGVQLARGQGQDVSRSLFQSYRLGNDIGQSIEQIVSDSEKRVAAANETVYAQARNRLILIGSGYVAAILVGLLIIALVQRSITRPVAQLRAGAESFTQGQMEITIPSAGGDELAVLAQTFNHMAAQVRDLIANLEQRVAERTRDAERRAIQLTTAADVGRVVASILDLEALIGRVVEVVRERFDLYYAAVFLVDETGRYAVLEAGTGEAGRQMKAANHRLEVGGLSMVGAACALRQPRVAQDVGHEVARFDNPLLPGTRSEAALPLVAGNRLLGAIDVQSTQTSAFSPDDIAVLQLVAGQVAVAIENARLFTQVQNALQAERRAYGEVSRTAWTDLIRRQATLGYTSDQRGLTAVAAPGDWTSEPEMDAVLRDGRVLAGPGRPEKLLAPIRIRDQVIGVIDASKPEGTGEWTEEETALVQVLVDQLGLALDSARLYHDVQRRAARERVAAEVTAHLRETLDVEKVLQAAAYQFGEIFGASQVEVRLAPGGNGQSTTTNGGTHAGSD